MLVGDEVVTRRNDRSLRTDRGLMVKNRDHWTITNIHPDGDVTLDGRTGTIRLPAEYVAEDLELGYAQTSHATQGRTVDVALLLVDAPTDSRGIYTPMTRGREATTPTSLSKTTRLLSTCSRKPSAVTGSTSPRSPGEPNSTPAPGRSPTLLTKTTTPNSNGASSTASSGAEHGPERQSTRQGEACS